MLLWINSQAFRALPRGINNQDLQNLGQNLEVGTCYSALTCVKMGQCVNIVLYVILYDSPSRLSMRRVDSGKTQSETSFNYILNTLQFDSDVRRPYGQDNQRDTGLISYPDHQKWFVDIGKTHDLPCVSPK